MQEVCNSLADTGSSSWLPIIGGLLIVIIAAMCLLYARRHGKRLTYSGFGMLLFVILGLITVSARPARAASTCNATSSSTNSTSATPSQSGKLELVDDTIQSSDFELQTGGDGIGPWSGTFDILANDHAPAGDPIDPNTVRLSPSSGQFNDFGSYDNLPAGVEFGIYGPEANPSEDFPIGDIILDGVQWGDYDPVTDTYTPNDYSHLTGKIYVRSSSGLPNNTTVTLHYTAKTMSGKDASNTATITITLPPLPLPPAPPQLVDDNYTLGTSGGAVLPVLDNDQPDANDPLNITTLELQNPNTEAGGYGTYYCTDPNGNQSYSGDSTAICWEVIDGKVVVTFGDDVPTDTPLSISYHITSEGGLEPDQDGVITVTRSSTVSNAISVSMATFPNCSYTPATLDLTSFVTANQGALDPSTVDLDPATPGIQKEYYVSSYHLSVDNNGLLTVSGGWGMISFSSYFTIQNTLGTVSPVGVIYATSPCT